MSRCCIATETVIRDSAKLCLDFKLLARRPALQSPDLAGWKAYPVRIEATLIRGVFKLKGSITVEYSSTCPCSAALARQLIAQFFWADFPQGDALAREDVVALLNGQNFMYVEDAARRIQSALSGHFTNVRTHVRHLESLHSHDAVASAV